MHRFFAGSRRRYSFRKRRWGLRPSGRTGVQCRRKQRRFERWSWWWSRWQGDYVTKRKDCLAYWKRVPIPIGAAAPRLWTTRTWKQNPSIMKENGTSHHCYGNMLSALNKCVFPVGCRVSFWVAMGWYPKLTLGIDACAILVTPTDKYTK